MKPPGNPGRFTPRLLARLGAGAGRRRARAAQARHRGRARERSGAEPHTWQTRRGLQGGSLLRADGWLFSLAGHAVLIPAVRGASAGVSTTSKTSSRTLAERLRLGRSGWGQIPLPFHPKVGPDTLPNPLPNRSRLLPARHLDERAEPDPCICRGTGQCGP